MSTQNSVTQSPTKINTQLVNAAFTRAFHSPTCSPNGDDPEKWLQDKISQYEAQVSQLEAELKHARILLSGHQTWLADCQRRRGVK